MRSLLARIAKLEQIIITAKMPGVWILIRDNSDGSLRDQQTGEIVPDNADFFGLRVILNF